MTQYCLRFQLLWNNLKHKHKQTSHALLYLLSRESLGASGTDKNTRRETRDFYFYTVYVWQYNTKNCYKTDFNAKNGRVCVFSDASGEDERGARTALLRELAGPWRHARPVRADWPRWQEYERSASESFRDSESFESNDSFTRKMIQRHRNTTDWRHLKSNQIKSLLLSHHHSTSALVSEILKSVLQTVQKNNNNNLPAGQNGVNATKTLALIYYM